MKKFTLGVIAFSMLALLGVGIVAAFPMDFSKGIMAKEIGEEASEEILAFQNSLRTAIENNDFDAWKSLMESQITEENFNKIVERHENMKEEKAFMEMVETVKGMANTQEQLVNGFKTISETLQTIILAITKDEENE